MKDYIKEMEDIAKDYARDQEHKEIENMNVTLDDVFFLAYLVSCLFVGYKIGWYLGACSSDILNGDKE